MSKLFGECKEGGYGLPGRGTAVNLNGAEAVLLEVENQEGWRDGVAVSGVKVVVSGEDGETFGVGGFHDETAIAPQHARCGAEEVGETLWRKMFEDLCAEEAVEGSIGLGFEPEEEIGGLGCEPLGAAERDGFLAEIHAAGGDAGFAEEFEEFAAAAAEVGNRSAIRKEREIEALLGFDVVLRTAKTFGEFEPVERWGGRGGELGRCGRGRNRRGPLAEEAKLGVDQALEIETYLLEVGPKTPLDLSRRALEFGDEIGVLVTNQIAEVRLRESDAVLEGALKFSQSAEEVNFVVGELTFPLGTPSGPMGTNILEFGRFGLKEIRAALKFLAQFIEEAADTEEGSVDLVQGFEDSIEGGQDGAVEFDLLADVPVERSREETLDELDGGVERTGRAWVDGADGRDLALSGIAGMEDGHEVGERNLDGFGGGGCGVARADAVPDLSDKNS